MIVQVRPTGYAFGKLTESDKIISVNGTNVKDLSHAEMITLMTKFKTLDLELWRHTEKSVAASDKGTQKLMEKR